MERPAMLGGLRTSGPRMVGVLDIGSSAMRLEVAQIASDGSVEELEHLQRAVPLGRDVFSQGRIETRTINLAIEILRGWQRLLEQYGVTAVRAVATSAVREAKNQELFVERVYLATDIAVEVIAGPEESRLLYAAVADAFREAGVAARDDALIVEQGAGSLEIALLREGEVAASGSYPLGTIRLRNVVTQERRGPRESLDLMKRHVAASLDGIEHTFPLDKTRELIVVGGDARFAADRLLGPPGKKRVRAVRREALLRFARGVGRLRPEEAAHKWGLPFEEAETLGPALVTFGEILKRMPARRVWVPDVSMRDGVLLDLIAEETGVRQREVEAQTYASAENLGRRYQFDEPHARQVADTACALFDALADEHGMGRGERRLLRVAALLHDVGLFVSSNSHHKHSEYLIGASDLFGVRAEERAIVACVARYHRRAAPQLSHPGYASLSRQDRAKVSKLAAMLRIADALDRGHGQEIRLLGAELGPEELVVRVATSGDLALERLAMRSKGELFEEVFGRKVVLQREEEP